MLFDTSGGCNALVAGWELAGVGLWSGGSPGKPASQQGIEPSFRPAVHLSFALVRGADRQPRPVPAILALPQDGSVVGLPSTV